MGASGVRFRGRRLWIRCTASVARGAPASAGASLTRPSRALRGREGLRHTLSSGPSGHPPPPPTLANECRLPRAGQFAHLRREGRRSVQPTRCEGGAKWPMRPPSPRRSAFCPADGVRKRHQVDSTGTFAAKVDVLSYRRAAKAAPGGQYGHLRREGRRSVQPTRCEGGDRWLRLAECAVAPPFAGVGRRGLFAGDSPESHATRTVAPSAAADWSAERSPGLRRDRALGRSPPHALRVPP
jgi:hypothetical protein